MEATEILGHVLRVGIQSHFDLRAAGIQEGGIQDFAGQGQRPFIII
jgi:hypothetical protein